MLHKSPITSPCLGRGQEKEKEKEREKKGEHREKEVESGYKHTSIEKKRGGSREGER